MKKAISILLAAVIAISVIVPGLTGLDFADFATKAEATTANATDAYATVFATSDFQDGRSGNLVEANFKAAMNNALADGCNEPDGFILGGDYESSYADKHSTPDAYHRVENIITDVFPYYNKKNIIALQGNHDINDTAVLDDTGLYEFEHYLVYVIANEDYPAGTGGENARAKTLATVADLNKTFDKLLAEGETRPLFIATHIPLHHNSRNPKANNKDADGNVLSTGYNETLYSKYLFDAVQSYSRVFDIIFMYGHNHSGDYDDYIGGAVNYLAKGDTIRIPDFNEVPSESSYDPETLNFTYMNYGYIGYSNNKTDATLTMSAFEICPDRIVLTRYNTETEDGKERIHSQKTITRNIKINTPSVSVIGYPDGTVGSATGALAIASGFTDPVYSWSSTDNDITKITATGRTAQIHYNKAGTATITVTVTERNNPSISATASHSINITAAAREKGSTIRISDQYVVGKSATASRAAEIGVIENYDITFGKKFSLVGNYEGFSGNANVVWDSTNKNVATVNNGEITLIGSGTTFIQYSATDTTGETFLAQVKLVVSNAPKVEYKYVLVDKSTFADNDNASYILTSGNSGKVNVMSGTTEFSSARNTNIMKSAGTVSLQSMDGTQGFYWDDDSCVWDKVSLGTSGNYALQNSSSGLYLRTRNNGNEVAQTLTTTSNKSDVGATFTYTSDGKIVTPNNGFGPRWTSNGWFEANSSASPLYLFKRVAITPSASIEFRGDIVNGTVQTVHSVTDYLKIPAYGRFTNIEEVGAQTWKSTNESVVTVDENGVLSFHAIEGTSIITYSVTDTKSGQTYSASFTVETKLGSEFVRTFKYTKTIQPGKKYLILNQTELGQGMMLTGYEVSDLRLLAEYVDIQLDSSNDSFVNIEADNTYPVWITESAGGDSYYLKNENDGSYFYAFCDGTYDTNYGALNGEVFTSASYAENTERFKWTYTGSTLYNQSSYSVDAIGETSDKTFIRIRSAAFPGIGTQKDRNVYLFEEIEAVPNGVITLRYNVLGSRYTANGICPGQTDDFGAKAENFPDNSQVDFRWSIAENDEDLASVDPVTGVVTYTGKSGNLTLTLTSTSKIYGADGTKPVDTTTVEVIINGGEIDAPTEPDEPENPDAPVYTENAFYKTTELIPGRKYVLHTSYSDAPNLAVSNVNKSGLVRLLCETTNAPQTDANGEYIATTNNAHIWECIDAGNGYVYLQNVGNGQYLFASESATATAKRQAGVAADKTHPEAANVTNPGDSFLFTYNSSKGMLFSKQVEDVGSVYGIGNVAKSSSNYYYLRATYDGSSSSPVSFITLYAEPEKESGGETTGSNYYYLTDSFVAGKEYILRAVKENESGNAISIAVSGTKNSSNTNRLNGTDVTSVDGIIQTEDKNIVWIAEAGSDSTHFYLKNAKTGEYLRVDKNGDIVTTSSTKDANAELIYYDKNGQMVIGSKASSANLIRYSNGAFYESSSGAVFELYAQGDAPEGGGNTEVPEGDIYIYTEELVPGRKYIITTGKTGNVSVMSTATHNEKDYEAPKTIKADVLENGSDLYIANPHGAIVVECVPSDVDGYYYLKDENNRYLVIGGYSANSGTNKAVEFTDSLTEYAEEAYTIRVRMTSSDYTVLESRVSDIKYLTLYESSSNPANNRFVGGKSYQEICLFAYNEEISTDVTVSTQIRTLDYFGSINITNVTQYRYEIDNGDTEQLYRYLENVEEGYNYTWSSSDTSIAEIGAETGVITFKGTSGSVTFSLNVTGTDVTGAEVNRTVSTTFKVSSEPYKLSDNDYPSYPDEGSIRVNKTASNAAGKTTFQKSGVTEIELGVTGVPVSQPVDVVVVLDHSDSMNGNNQLLNAIRDTRNFALQLFNENENNRIAIVTFDQFRYHYESISSTEIKYSETGNEDRIISGDGTIYGAFVKADQIDNLVNDIEGLAVNAYGGTNYDSGLNYAYKILKNAKTDPEANENQVVVFMSDGAPTKFNGLKLDKTDTGSLGEAWLNGDENHSELASYLANTTAYPAAKLFNTDGNNWYAEAIKTPEGDTVEGMPNHTLYEGYHEGIGAKIYTIGYNSGAQAAQLLTRIASDPSYYYPATSDLKNAYNSILQQILYSATDAVVTDKMGDHFDVQFDDSFLFGSEGSATTVTLDPAPKFEVGYWTLDNAGNRVDYHVIEKITFTTNENGNLISAYSDSIGNCYDVASSTINGRYVSYDLNREIFTWNIGAISKTEITLKYYACLEGAAKGEREAGTFDTNEYAKLSYTNFRGTENCEKVFPVPVLAWEQAAVSYDFYLVNANGQTINLYGDAVPFAERVTIGREQTKKLLLNGNGEFAYTLIADDELPEGYELYNEEAYYSVTVSGSNGNATISDSSLTTYFRDGSYAINVNGTVPNVSAYTNTAVSFAVKATEGVIPDSIVIDYGLPVKINVLGNDYVADGGVITGVSKTVVSGATFNSKGNNSSVLDNGGKTNIATVYGMASVVEDANVYGQYYIVYTPATTNMPTEDVFYYEYKVNNTYYCAKVTVIPAANIYYEESFMEFVDGNGYTWEDVETTLADKYQAEDRPGTFSFEDFDANNSYGEDSAYNDSYTYSLGSAKKTTVDTKAFGKEPTATFTFSGTGFDFFSVTSNDTGAVLVRVKGATTSNQTFDKSYIVNTYYGYKSGTDSEGNPTFGPDADSTTAMYQVPVVSKRDLTYGTYTVTIKPMYSSAFDPNYANGSGDYSIYVDSVRIFNPAGVGGNVSDVIGDAYLKDGEYAPVFKDLRNTLLESEKFYGDEIGSFKDENGNSLYSGSLYLDGNTSNAFDQSGVATYKKQGPNNEVYLGKNQAVAFMVSSDDEEALASLQLGMKVVSGSGTAQVVIMNSSEKYPNSFELSGAHETFKKLNSAIIWDYSQINYEDMSKNKYVSLYPIIIANVSDTVISLTSFKWAHTTPPELASAASLDFMIYDSTPMVATMALRNAMATMEDSDETKLYDDADVSIEWSDETFTEGKEATLKVTTPPEVVKVTVDGIEITECDLDENGNKIWTYTFVVQQSGENAYEVVLYDYNGNPSEPFMTETIYVEEAEDEPVTDGPTTDDPSNDGSEDDSPASEESLLDKAGKVANDIFNSILNFFKTVITFIWRLFA